MVSPARTAALLSYFVIECIMAVVLYFILEVPRAPLPRDAIGALMQAVGNSSEVPWPLPHISVSAAPGALVDTSLQAFAEQLASNLELHGVRATVEVNEGAASVEKLRGLEDCTADGTNSACLAAMEDLGAKAPDDGGSLTSATFNLVLVPTASCSALLLDVGTSAILRLQQGSSKDLAQLASSRLVETWFKKLPLLNASPLFEISPSYLFSFFLVSDCKRRVAWDFQKGVLVPYLRRFTGRLQELFDFEFDSQVVQCSSLKGSVSQDDASKKVNVEELKADFLRNAGEWPGDTVTKDAKWLAPLVRLAAFWPSTALRVLDSEGQPQRAFAVPGWGAVALAGGEDSVCKEQACSHLGANVSSQFLSPCESQRIASAWVSILRAWLTLRPESVAPATSVGVCDGLALFTARPQLDGIARWEQVQVAKVLHTLFVRRAAETLQNFMALVDSLPDLQVPEEIVEDVSKAAASAQQSISKAAEGDLNGALTSARLALRLSLTASHDDTVVAQMYFSWQFKWAVYLPLLLPVAVPTLVGLWREIKRDRELKQLQKKKESEAVTEEVQ